MAQMADLYVSLVDVVACRESPGEDASGKKEIRSISYHMHAELILEHKKRLNQLLEAVDKVRWSCCCKCVILPLCNELINCRLLDPTQ